MVKVYIASPYTKGDVAVNVKRQIDCTDELITLGFAPYTPLYSHYQHMAHPRPYEDWIRLDKEWVLVCDCVLRLSGESSGADGEVQLAIDNNIPVFYSIESLVSHYAKHVDTSKIKVGDKVKALGDLETVITRIDGDKYYFNDNAGKEWYVENSEDLELM